MVNDSQLPDDPHPSLGAVSANIYRLLRASPSGLSITDIRQKLGVGEGQEHLDRRIRDLRRFYVLEGAFRDGLYVYTLKGVRAQDEIDSSIISGKLRAQILHQAHGRCQMCGRTVADDGVKLQVDHKTPQSWGGQSVPENLWAICEQCNNGKRDYFDSFDDDELKRVIAYPSVHERIAHALKMKLGEPVSSRLLEFVANAVDVQEDWHKRLRELRYPPIGLHITVGKRRTPEGYVESTYTLHNWKDLPADHKKLIRDWDNGKR